MLGKKITGEVEQRAYRAGGGMGVAVGSGDVLRRG
jgi:hypothetical protein